MITKASRHKRAEKPLIGLHLGWGCLRSICASIAPGNPIVVHRQSTPNSCLPSSQTRNIRQQQQQQE
jgi:hypothetical protein